MGGGAASRGVEVRAVAVDAVVEGAVEGAVEGKVKGVV